MKLVPTLLTIALSAMFLSPAFGQEATVRIGPEPDDGRLTTPESAGVREDPPAKGEDRPAVIVHNTNTQTVNPVTERTIERHNTRTVVVRGRKVSDGHIRNVVSDAGFATQKWVGDHHYTKDSSDAAHTALAEMLGSHAPAAGSAASTAPEEGEMSGTMIGLILFFGFLGLIALIAGIAAISGNGGTGTRTATTPLASTLTGLVPGGRDRTMPVDADAAILKGNCDIIEYDWRSGDSGSSYRKIVHHDPPPQCDPRPQPALPAPATTGGSGYVPSLPPRAKAVVHNTFNVNVGGAAAPAAKPAITPPTPAPPAPKPATPTTPKPATPAKPAAPKAPPAKPTTPATPPPPAPKTPTPAPVPKPATPAAKAATTPPKSAATPAAPAKAGKPAGRKPAARS